MLAEYDDDDDDIHKRMLVYNSAGTRAHPLPLLCFCVLLLCVWIKLRDLTFWLLFIFPFGKALW